MDLFEIVLAVILGQIIYRVFLQGHINSLLEPKPRTEPIRQVIDSRDPQNVWRAMAMKPNQDLYVATCGEPGLYKLGSDGTHQRIDRKRKDRTMSENLRSEVANKFLELLRQGKEDELEEHLDIAPLSDKAKALLVRAYTDRKIPDSEEPGTEVPDAEINEALELDELALTNEDFPATLLVLNDFGKEAARILQARTAPPAVATPTAG